MLNKLREKNKLLLEKHKDNPELFHKHEVIGGLLKDDYCFIKIDVDMAFSILADLEVKEEKMKQVYLELISKL